MAGRQDAVISAASNQMIRAVRFATGQYLHKHVTGNGTDAGEIAIVGGTFWIRLCPAPPKVWPQKGAKRRSTINNTSRMNKIHVPSSSVLFAAVE